MPALLCEWNYERNVINPCDIKAGSGTKVWWKCKKGHEWQVSPNHRKKGVAVQFVQEKSFDGF